MKRLDEIADVMVGQIMTRVSSNDGSGKDVKVMIPGAVNQGYVNKNALGNANIIKELDKKFYTQPGDLVMKLTADYDVAIIGEEDLGTVLSSFICVIRSKEINPNYLCAVLNSDFVKNMLKTKAAGAIRPMIRVTDIRDILIPEVDEEKQKKIGDAYVLSREKIQLLQEMIENECLLMDAVISNCVMEVVEND